MLSSSYNLFFVLNEMLEKKKAFSFKKHVLRNEIGVLLSKMLWLQLTAAQDMRAD